MTGIDPRNARGIPAETTEMVVGGPRPTDAIGDALGRAYAMDRDLPADMTSQIRKLEMVRRSGH